MAGLLTGNSWEPSPRAPLLARRRRDITEPSGKTVAPISATHRASAPCEPPHPYSASVVDDLETLKGLEETWSAFVSAAGKTATAFQSFSFCGILAKHALANDPHRKLHVVAVHGSNGKPVLILPLTVTTRMGVVIAEWLGDPVNQYGDVIAPQTPDDTALDTALSAVSLYGPPDLFDFRRVREDALIAGWLKRRGQPVGMTGEGPYIDLTLDNRNLPFLSGRRKKDRRRKLRKIDQHGNAVFEASITGERAGELTALCLEMKLKWLEEKGLVSRALSQQWVRDALVEFAGRSEHAMVSMLSVDGNVASMDIGFVDGHCYYAFLGVMDYAYADASPGDLLTERIVDWCRANGIERYDWMPPLQRYKMSWSSGTTSVVSYDVARTWRGKAYARLFVGFLEPRLKDLFYRSPEPVRRLAKAVFRRVRRRR